MLFAGALVARYDELPNLHRISLDTGTAGAREAKKGGKAGLLICKHDHHHANEGTRMTRRTEADY